MRTGGASRSIDPTRSGHAFRVAVAWHWAVAISRGAGTYQHSTLRGLAQVMDLRCGHELATGGACERSLLDWGWWPCWFVSAAAIQGGRRTSAALGAVAVSVEALLAEAISAVAALTRAETSSHRVATSAWSTTRAAPKHWQRAVMR